ncbi:MAG: LamB/YcsF family protein [Thermomicrobiales bacterium]
MQQPSIDLNSDLGESFGAYRVGYDAELFPLISSANVACGLHGGDPRVMERTVRLAAEHGVAVGAHPSYPDLVGFGRRVMASSPDEVRTDVLYQLGALDAFCRAVGVRMRHVKAHGALYNHATTDATTAAAIAAAVAAFDPELILFAMPGSALFLAGEAAGLTVAREAFADRAYNADGTLVSRREPGALITDPEEAARRMVRLVREGRLTSIDGKEIDLDAESICIHSDTPGANEIARVVRRRLTDAGIAVRAPGVT